MFKVFIDDWSKTIRNLPKVYNDNVKEKVIIEHSRKGKVFGVKSLLIARSKNVYNIFTFRAYSKVLAHHSGLRIVVLVMIAIIPKIIFRIFRLGEKVLKLLKR